MTWNKALTAGWDLTPLWVAVEHSIQDADSVSGVKVSIDQLGCQSRRRTGCGQGPGQTGTHTDEMDLHLSPTTSNLDALGDLQETAAPSPQSGTGIW